MREILLLVGTDHHAFQRAVSWADARAAAYPDERVFIQYGKSEPPHQAEGQAFLTPDQMREAVARADVVITHGGPGTISDARHGGHRPIVFPRDPEHGEHVDDHQQRFAGWCDRRGLVHFAHTTADLDDVVGRLGPVGTKGTATTDPASVAAISRVATLLDGPQDAPRVRPGAPVILHLSADSRSEISKAESVVQGTVGIMLLGDTTQMWRAGLGDNESCECGEKFADCEFWTKVGENAFGGWDKARADGIVSAAQQSPGRLLGLARRYLGRSHREAALAYAAPYRALFTAAREVSGVDVICDSSPFASALAWSHDRQLDVRSLRTSGRNEGIAARIRGLASVSAASDSMEREIPRALRDLLGTSWTTESAAKSAAKSTMGAHRLSARIGPTGR